MSNRRGKSQARRNTGNSRSGLPAWAWLVIGVLITLLVVLAAPRFLGDGEGGFLRPKPNPDAQPRGSAETDGAFEPPASGTVVREGAKPADAKKGENYDFYDLLPGQETAMTDAQIAAIAREEARRKAEEASRRATTEAAADTGLPQPLPEGGAPNIATGAAEPAAAAARAAEAAERAAGAKPATTVASAKPAATPIASTATAPKPATTTVAKAEAANDAKYILQAGAFQASGDAEALKARIALLGLSARVESASINGKTMYRVRMGPYGSATDLADAKSKLSSGGLPAVPVKVN